MKLDIFLSYIYIAFQFIDNDLEFRIEKLIWKLENLSIIIYHLLHEVVFFGPLNIFM